MSTEKATWLWVLIAALICGVMTAIGWIMSIYAYMTTPEVNDMIFPTSRGGIPIQGNAIFLFMIPLFQAGQFLIALLPVIRWKHFVCRTAERLSPRDVWQTNPNEFSFPKCCKFTSVVMCIIGGITLYATLQRAIFLINKF